jgi:Tol biopolymer transport system component
MDGRMHALRRRIWLLMALLIGVSMMRLTGCLAPAPAAKLVTIETSDMRLVMYTTAGTVREVLQQAGISLGQMDRVEPDLWQEVQDGATVRVVRVEERQETERRPIPFSEKIIKSEALPPGERKLLQLGVNGEEEIVYRLVLEDGQVVERTEAQRIIIKPPVDEIIAVGLQANLPSVPITGTLVYISAGNAWVMRGTSASRRPLTSSGDLDGRVLALSPDGEWLVYSRAETGGRPHVLNSLWIVGTSILNEPSYPLGIEGVMYAEWTADGKGIIYSTAERTGGAPGWRAHNDIWKATIYGLTPAGKRTGNERITALTQKLLDPPAETVYSWWGTHFALSPDGRWLAYGQADEVGIIDLRAGTRSPLLHFAAYHTYGEWVWLPELSWSPDSRYLACSVHGQVEGMDPEDSPVFDLWVVERTGAVKVPIAPDVGMWTAPAWSPARRLPDGSRESAIAFGVAYSPRSSQDSRYDLYVMDRDGSNRRKLFPPADMPGLVAPELAWSPDGRQMVIAHQGYLYLLDVDSGTWQKLTADGQSGQPRWAGEPTSSEEDMGYGEEITSKDSGR